MAAMRSEAEVCNEQPPISASGQKQTLGLPLKEGPPEKGGPEIEPSNDVELVYLFTFSN